MGDNFDLIVRRELKKDLHRTLGKAGKIPYLYALLVGLPPFHVFLAWSGHCPLSYSATVAFELLLLRFPLCVCFTLFICNRAKWTCSMQWLDRLVDSLVALATSAVVFAMTYAAKALDTMEGRAIYGGRRPWYIVW